MKTKVIFLLTFILTLIAAQPAMANQAPSPHVIFSELLILPIMIILTLMGGGYLIMNRLRKKKSGARKVFLILGAILLVMISGMNEGLGFTVAVIFGIIALRRGFKMISWGRGARSDSDAPEHLAGAKPRRLIPAGSILVAFSIFLMGMAFAFLGNFPDMSQERQEKSLKEFVAYQLAYASLAKSENGNVRYHRITKDSPEYQAYFRSYSYMYQSPDIRFEYGADEKNFTVYMVPARFPLFPYNYLTSKLSYRTDETGQIRMIRVRKRNVLCPPDAPTVMTVQEEDIRRAILVESIKQEQINISRLVENYSKRKKNSVHFSLDRIGWVKPEALGKCECRFRLEVTQKAVYAVVAEVNLDTDAEVEVWEYNIESGDFRRTSND